MDIGQKVRVRRIRDRVSQEVVGKLGKFGTVVDFKVTDGNGVGVLVKFDDNYTTWFFDDEVEAAA
ncbi:MAG: cytochrome b6f subunit family protein [Synechococcales bacterium]|nr:cytochrome b6f subunit family protein [Synechococcales bacterium]